MPEKPPTMPPPDENFGFSHDIHNEAFDVEWTSAMRKRIQQLLEEIDWGGAHEDEARMDRLYEAYRLAIQDQSTDVSRIAARVGRDETRMKHWWEGFFKAQIDRIAIVLEHGNVPSATEVCPIDVGPILLRMKEILGGKA